MLLFTLCGCTINVNYDFDVDNIKSSISSNFNYEEYVLEIDDEMIDDVEKEQSNERIINDKESTYIPAFLNNTTDRYVEKEFTNDDGNYSIVYTYDYDYNNFINNYILNHCFDNFEFSEDEDYYNVKITGNYTCNKNVKLNFTAKNGIVNDNSVDVKDGVFSWDVFETDNNIFFSVMKKPLERSKSVSVIRIITFIVLVILIVATYFILRYTDKNNSY